MEVAVDMVQRPERPPVNSFLEGGFVTRDDKNDSGVGRRYRVNVRGEPMQALPTLMARQLAAPRRPSA